LKNEQEKQKVLAIINEVGKDPSFLIQVLNAIQEEQGYIPRSVQELVAREMKIPFSRVFEVSSFYSRFTTEPKGKYEISVCLGTACYVKGAQLLLDDLKAMLGIVENQTTPDGLFTLIASRCIGACGIAPAILVNHDVHGFVTREMLPELLDSYRSRKDAGEDEE